MLSAEYGIGVRHGCFCLHPLMLALLGIDADVDADIYDRLLRREPVSMPGAVRLSMGLATNRADIPALVEAVETIATDGPRWTYGSAPDGSNSWPFPDTRPRPTFPFELAP